jgi:hypothetical protein
MRYFLVFILLLAASLVFAVNVEQCLTLDNRVSVRLNQFKTAPDITDNSPGLMISTQTYALPYRQANVQVYSMLWNVYDSNGTFIKTEDKVEQNTVSISNTFTFREMNGVTVSIINQLTDGNNYKVLNQVEFDVVGFNPVIIPQSVSSAFVKSYQKLAANYNSSYLRDLPIARPKLLIISHTSLTPYIVNFVQWKKAKGYEVFVLNRQDIGNDAITIRNAIRTHYLQYQCDFLLLLGDVTGSYPIPTNIYSSPDGLEQDADDNFYTMLTGEDYFPEMLVGRFSFGDISEFLTISNKTIYYEKTPYMTNTAWMKKGLTVAGNYAEGGLHPVTPVQMSRWLREKMLSKGYTQVDTVFYPPTYPGTSSIISYINQGVQYISYRGWGAADGWHYPAFHNQDLESLLDSPRMPIVFSIVCNTGDFSNSLNPCFGEKWMLQGTISSPGGCVAFVGPSDLHTKTNLNNTISTGIYSSIFDDGERNFGAAVLAGKIELYNNYPLELGTNQLVAFYFHVYNILSDPSMNMWMLVPETIPATVLTNGTTFSQADSHIRIEAANLNGAIVTGTKDSLVYTYTTVNDGVAILPINPEQAGNLLVTISKENFVPLVTTLMPSQPAVIGVANAETFYNGEIIWNPGNGYYSVLHIKNYSPNTLSNIAVHFSAEPSTLVSVAYSDTTIASIAPGATVNLTVTIFIHPDAPADQIITLNLSFPGLSGGWSFEHETGGAKVLATQHNGTLNIGAASTVALFLQNIGTDHLHDGTVTVHSLTTAAEVINEQTPFTFFTPDNSLLVNANILVQPGCFNGRAIPLYITVSNPAGYQTSCYYTLTAGNPTSSDPTGPDQYGYFAYDNTDVDFPEHPTYQWIEIDPRDGGSGTVTEIMDDGSYTVDLPFSFRYYGNDYSQMTICSNGWVSFIPTWMTDFNNLYIPAALGPYAMVAPYWDDLKGMKTGEDSLGNGFFNNIRIITFYDSANNRYIVEWNDAYSNYNIDLLDGASLEIFQLLLYPNVDNDGNIVFQYHTIDNPAVTSNYSTVGIENHLQNDGLTYSFANFYPITASPLQNGLAVKFTTTPPDSFVENNDQLQAILPFGMMQNYPNPFNPETKISFNVNRKADISLEIYNLKGQKIRTLLDVSLAKGQHQIIWDGKDDKGLNAGSGVYIYKMKSGSHSEIKKMILLK